MLTAFKTHINNNFPFLKESKLLIAISGGMDSVVLTYICKESELTISLAHCNFNLRGKESDADEDFVVNLADDLDLEVFVQDFDTQSYANDTKLSIQMAARELRYAWFFELSNQLQFDYILTAHHADDNLETFLINLSRGTGLDGLIGIPEINEKIVRPLLPFSRSVIEAYAIGQNLKWCEDSSNASTKYLRNKLRHNVIPALKETNPQFLHNFLTTQKYLSGINEILQEATSKVFEDVVDKITEDEIHFNVLKLKKYKNVETYLFQLLKDYHFTSWEDIYNLLDAQSGKYVTSVSYRLLKNRNHLILSKIPNEENIGDLKIDSFGEKVETPIGKIQFEIVDEITESNDNTIFVDKDLLKFPLTVRLWKNGDYFYPFGMQGKKKLSKFFKDEKLSVLEKERAFVLCTDDKVVWVLSKRLDNRFKVTSKTKTILKITIYT